MHLQDGWIGDCSGLVYRKLHREIITHGYALGILIRWKCHGKNKVRLPVIPLEWLSFNILDLEFKGSPYTWTNNQRSPPHLRERLDKALATITWRQLFLYAQVHHEAFLGSDHCPLLLHCHVPPKRVPHQFKFESMWTTSPMCAEIIRTNWSQLFVGFPMLQVSQKLQSCKHKLSKWSKIEFGDNRRRIT